MLTTAQVMQLVWWMSCYLHSQLVAAGTIEQSTFSLIPTTRIVKDCQLEQTDLKYLPYGKVYPYFECAKKCMASRGCTLFCLGPDRRTCTTFKLFMSHAFNEKLMAGATTTPVYACYSSWAHGQNLLTSFMSMKTSPLDTADSTPEKAIDGICCLSSYSAYRFQGASGQRNYWLVDLMNVVTLAELRIAGSLRYFQSVVILFGNSSDQGSNPTIAKIGSPSAGDNRVYLEPHPVGRYLVFASTTTDKFDVCEVQVIPAV